MGITPEEYLAETRRITPEQYEQGATLPEMEEHSFIAKHPNLYGAFGVAQSLIPYLKYVDPHEREKFAKLSTKKQTRDLLLENFETIGLLAAPAITKGVVPLVARYLPKTYKAFKFIKTPIKEMGELARRPAKEVAEAGLGRIVTKIPPRPRPKLPEVKVKKPLTPKEKFLIDDAPKLTKEEYYKKAEKYWDIEDISRPDYADRLEVRERILKLRAREARPIILEAKISTDDPVKRVTEAIKAAASTRKVQEQIYSVERSQRLGKAMAAAERVTGEKRFPAMLKELKGELTKVEFESLRGKIGQKDINQLFEMVWKSPDIKGYENVTAWRGLGKLFGEFGGKVPQQKELELLRKVFPEEFIQTLLKKRPLFQEMTEAGLQLANIPRSIMASFDLSAPFRQGLFLISHPKRFTQSFMKMFRLFGSEDALTALQDSIAQKPTYELMKESGLMLTRMGETMALREEAFVSQWAEKIPLIGRGVRASGRAHLGFLNKLRADVFEDLVMKAERLGLDPKNNMDLTKGIANFVNLASGRGSLGALERSAVPLNTFFFSPRLMASRLTLLNPVYYIKQDPFVRKEALKSLFVLSGVLATTLGLAKAGGLKVGTDWRSADFAKIKIGDTRIDIMGGFQQYIRALGQIASGEYVSSTTGKVVTLGEGYRPLTRYEIALRQIESKEAPIFSFITDLMKGQEISGEKISIPKEVGRRFIPMAISDIYEIAKEDPDLLPISFLGAFGVGLQTYKGRAPKLKGGITGIKGFGKLK